MSTTEVTDAPVPESVTDKREEKIRGLRELADFLDANPDVPAPTHMTGRTYYYAPKGGQFIAVAKALGGEVVIDGNDVDVKRTFAGDVGYEITIPAREVCIERQMVSTGYVLPPDLDPAQTASQDDPRGEADR